MSRIRAFGMNIEEIREKFADAETVVYWDVEDFPVTDIDSFNRNTRLALADAGYRGQVSIRAYGYPKTARDEYKAAGITFIRRGVSRRRRHKMLVDMYFLAAANTSCAPKNVMFIAKDIIPDDEPQTGDHLNRLNTSCYNVLLAVPDDFQLDTMPSELNYTVWRWSTLCAGGNPLDHTLVYRPFRPPSPPPERDDQERPAYLIHSDFW